MTEGEIWWTEHDQWSKEMLSRQAKGIEICSFMKWKGQRDPIEDELRCEIAALIGNPEVSPQRQGLAKLFMDFASR